MPHEQMVPAIHSGRGTGSIDRLKPLDWHVVVGRDGVVSLRPSSGGCGGTARPPRKSRRSDYEFCDAHHKMSLCATEGCSSPGRAGCFEPQKTEPRCACTGPPRFTALGPRSHAQYEQLKRAHSKQQNYDCDPIIFEPMPAHCIHGRTFPLSDSPVTLAHPCFQSYFAGKHFGFAVCGANRVNVSQFVAQIRHGCRRSRCT